MAVPFRSPRLRTPTLGRILSGGSAPARRPLPASRLAPVSTLRPRPLTPRSNKYGTLTGRPRVAPPLIAVSSTSRATEAAKTQEEKKDRPWYLSGFEFAKDLATMPFQIAKAMPTFIGKAGQTAVGAGEMILDVPTNIINPDLWRTRYERDRDKARAEGLNTYESFLRSTERVLPLLTDTARTFQRTGARGAEIGTLGFYDTGEPGFDYYRALRQGNLADLLFEDVGNVILAGRLSGAGNLGVRGGARLQRGAAPGSGRFRAGQALSSTARFVEEPIGSFARGTARVASEGLPRLSQRAAAAAAARQGTRLGAMAESMAPRFARAGETAAAMSQSSTPLMTGVLRSSERFRTAIDRNLASLDQQIFDLGEQIKQARQEGRTQDLPNLEAQQLRKTKQRSFRQGMSQTIYEGRRAQAEAKLAEDAVRASMVAPIIRFDAEGAVPETVDSLRARSAALRQQAESPTSTNAAAQVAQADFIDRMADVKERNPEKLQDENNRRINMQAAVIVNSKIIDQVMADIDAGFTLDEIMDRIQPRELSEQALLAQYGYTPEGVQRAIDFVQGRLDEVDLLEMDVASQLINTFAQRMNEYAFTPGTLVGGIQSPAQLGDIPMPEILVIELAGRSFRAPLLRLLDEQTANIVIEGFGDLADSLGDKLNNPEGLYERFAKSRPDSDEYTAAYFATARVSEMVSNPRTSVFSENARVANDVAEFFANPAIYAARMRPMLAYRESAGQMARASDVNSALYGLRQLAEEFPDIFGKKLAGDLQRLLDKMAETPTRQYDRDFYLTAQRLVDRVIRDITKRRGGTQERIGEVEVRIGETETRLAEIEAQARAAAAMVEQALLRPEELNLGRQQEAQQLRDEAAGLVSEAGRLAQLPDELDSVRQQINVQNDLLSGAQGRRSEAQNNVRMLEQRLEAERRVLDSANLDDDGLVRLVAEMNEAEMLARSGLGGDPTLAQQKAWKQEKVREARQVMDTWAGQFESLSGGAVPSPQRRGDLKGTATGGVQEVNVRRRGGLDINRMYLDSPDYIEYILRGIPNPSHRRAFYRDHTVRGSRREPGSNVEMPTRGGSIDEYAGNLTEEEFLTQLTEAYSNYMAARDEVRRLEEMPYKGKYGEQVKEAMVEEQRAQLDEYPWQDPITGEEIRGISSLAELRRIERLIEDPAALNEQRLLVETIRGDLEEARRKVQEADREARDIDRTIDDLVARARQAEASSPAVEANRLRSQAQRLIGAASEIDTQTARLRPRAARERLMLTRESGRRTRVANARLTDTTPREIEGYTFTKGVAKKLDAAEAKQLGEQQRLYNQTRQLQERLNRQDSTIEGAVDVQSGAQQYRSELGATTGRGLLQGANRPRLLGETDQPTWIPVGPASGVYPTVRAPKRITQEGMAPEQKISIERQRTSTLMPLTPGQFAARVNEILNQTGRNRVVTSILTNRMLTSDVDTILTPKVLADLQSRAEQKVVNDGIKRGTNQFKSAVQKEFGTSVVQELSRRGYEPVSRTDMPDPSDPYAGREAVGDLLGAVNVEDIKPTTLVMKKGLRNAIATDFALLGADKLPPVISSMFRFLTEKTAQWKSVILPFSIRWQVGDAAGNLINAAVRAGIDPVDFMAQVKATWEMMNPGEKFTWRTAGQDLFGSSIADPTIAALVGTGLQTANIKTSEIQRMLPENVTLARPTAGRLGGTRLLAPKFRERAFNFNETQNGIARSSVAILKLQKALEERGRHISEIDPVSIHNDPVLYEAVVDAVRQANDALGNFSQLTPTERQYIRTIYPFWSWIRFINTAAAQLLLNQPDRALFYAHLGSMVLSEDGDDFYGWLNKQVKVPTPWGPMLMDLSFLNPYADAFAFSVNPLESAGTTFTNVSPVISSGMDTLSEIYYQGSGGGRLPIWPLGTRPGYLEGRAGETSRTWGDTLGGIAYQNFRTFAGPYRFLTEVAPAVTVPGTDVQLGPGPRYGQGSPITTGTYSRPLLSPTQQRVSALLRGFGIPAPSASVEQARLRTADIQRAGRKSARRREKERRLSRIER